MDSSHSFFGFKKMFLYLIVAIIFCLTFQPASALTISPQSTTAVARTDDPVTRTAIFTATAPNANLNNITIQNALATTDVTIRDSLSLDIILSENTKVIWSSPYALTLNASQNIVINNQSQLISQGYGSLVLRADTTGNNEGTLIPPSDNGLSIVMNGSGYVKIFYRPKDYTTPTDFSSIIKVSSPEAATAYMAINNFADLQKMNLNLGGSYVLARNLDGSGIAFTPIGDVHSTSYTGRFDGQGYRINKLLIDAPKNNVGLFGDVSDAIIENVGLSDVNISGSGSVGGLVGSFYTTRSAVNIRRTFVTGNVSGKGYSDVGGLVGTVLFGKMSVSQSFSSGTVGGLEGSSSGGLIGNGKGSIIDNSYSTSKVSGPSSSAIGGLSGGGFNISCTNDYAAGAINKISNAGGLMGIILSPVSFMNVFWDKESTGITKPFSNAPDPFPGTTGLTTQEMFQKNTYVKAGWDFDSIWGMDEGSYPYLQWAKRTPPWTSVPNADMKTTRIVG